MEIVQNRDLLVQHVKNTISVEFAIATHMTIALKWNHNIVAKSRLLFPSLPKWTFTNSVQLS